MPYNTCGLNLEDLQDMFDDNTGIFMSLDGSAHDAHQHYQLIEAVVHPIMRRYIDIIMLSLEFSGLGSFKDKVEQGMFNTKYMLTSGNPITWKARIRGTIFSGLYYTYFANTNLVHCYIRFVCKIPPFVHIPQLQDKDSGDD